MSQRKGDRKTSKKTEFDNTYFKIFDDCINLIDNHFGANTEMQEEKTIFIRTMSEKVFNRVCDIGTYIRIANSYFPDPNFPKLLEERKNAQERATGLCFDILTKYQLIMTELKVPDDKHTFELKNLIHEINCLKSWRKSDEQRFS